MTGTLVKRVFHRQMYVDLMRAYLLDYGTRGDLARALGVSNPVITYFLRHPSRLSWGDLMQEQSGRWKVELRGGRTPSFERAREIASRLCSDAERRKVLLHHVDMARKPWLEHLQREGRLAGEGLQERVRELAALHSSGLHATDAEVTRISYREVWGAGLELLTWIDGGANPLERAQVLMVLNDAASVLDRPDLALAQAREAMLVLREQSSTADRHMVNRLRVNALLAEAVTLNNLRLARDAAEVTEFAMRQPGSELEPWNWRRSLLEQNLKALSGLPRFAMSEAEYLADRAVGSADGRRELVVGIHSYLATVYVRHGTARSLRKAVRLIDELRGIVASMEALVPLRRVRYLCAAAAVYRATNEVEARDEMVREAVAVSGSAGLMQKEAELRRLFPS